MKKKYNCCENCLFYKQYFTLHNFSLVKEDRGICCRSGGLCFVEDVCNDYETIEYVSNKSEIMKKVRAIRLTEEDK